MIKQVNIFRWPVLALKVNHHQATNRNRKNWNYISLGWEYPLYINIYTVNVPKTCKSIIYTCGLSQNIKNW
jgi:hypothetical protein